ncbi:phage protein Gp37 [Caulobacter soli]|uniref:phage protein Gp37 n=1 Tax=Caulobacter soli TaxID=2708539 RepID=UPI0013ED4C1A|nr:phage protein Gp37 [Caulobacter soli]
MIGEIENAMVKSLDAASKAGVLGYAYRDCESLPADIDERLIKKVPRYPAAWVTFASLRTLQQMKGGSAKVEASFAVIVAAENLRNERATRQGGSESEVGSYQMFQDAAGLLAGQTFGLPIEGLELGGVTPVTSPTGSERLSLFKVALTTRFVFSPTMPAHVAELADFETFFVAWDLPPHGDTDATSLITLETT